MALPRPVVGMMLRIISWLLTSFGGMWGVIVEGAGAKNPVSSRTRISDHGTPASSVPKTCSACSAVEELQL
eukprot:2900796-Amphidinium_carterae.1